MKAATKNYKKNSNAMYDHDCEDCIYHVTILINNESRYYDVYTCGEGDKKNLILRYGNEGFETLFIPFNRDTKIERYVTAKMAIELFTA